MPLITKVGRKTPRARIALLLISVDFLNSDFIKKNEIPEIFRRHEQEGMMIYPLLVRYCAWKQVNWLKELQIRPAGAKAIANYGNKIDMILSQVADEIAEIAKSVAKKSAKRVQMKPRAKAAKARRS